MRKHHVAVDIVPVMVEPSVRMAFVGCGFVHVAFVGMAFVCHVKVLPV